MTMSNKRREPDELDRVIESLKQIKNDKNKIDIKEVQALRKRFKETCDTAKRETQKLEAKATKKVAGTTRSGSKRGINKQQPVFSDGKNVNKGIDDSQEKYDASELAWLKKDIAKVKEVNELKFEHLKYLVIDLFLEDLKSIKAGTIESEFHNRYKALVGKSKADLFSEIKSTLFTNEQRDYLNGLLQGAFDTTSMDANGDIKHSDINYVEIVMFAEVIIRIVKFVHDFKTFEEAMTYMSRSSREAIGLDAYEDADD